MLKIDYLQSRACDGYSYMETGFYNQSLLFQWFGLISNCPVRLMFCTKGWTALLHLLYLKNHVISKVGAYLRFKEAHFLYLSSFDETLRLQIFLKNYIEDKLPERSKKISENL